MGVYGAGLPGGPPGHDQLSTVSLGSIALNSATFLFSFLLFLTVPEIAEAGRRRRRRTMSSLVSKELLRLRYCLCLTYHVVSLSDIAEPRVNEDMVAEVMRLGFEREALLEALRSRTANKASVTYYLLADNRRKLPSSGYRLPTWRRAARGRPWRRRGCTCRRLNRVGWKKTAPYALKCRATVRRPSCDGMLTPTGSLSMGGGGGLAGGATRMSDDLDDHLDLDSTPPPVQLLHPSHHHQHPQQQQHPHHPDHHMQPRHLYPRGQQQLHPMHPGQQHGSGCGAVAARPLVALGRSSGWGDGCSVAGLPNWSTLPARVCSGVSAGGAAGGRGSGNDAASQENSRSFVMHFESQMYKVRDDEYVIDIQGLDGELVLFMDVCGRVLSDLRI
ncbi:SNF1-related protein kinase catalytic subunit alpha KIN11 [Tetrabaena socialis]|uniref:non-specific serine/threonine protein kinase n=1 Tax=Tetrabaena socialis TaxID=47790 RepID=A0A2J8A770_9CHLO|nr:SNF1-related protein kinase catalytic subunit alpha KIN11 [Tetrabaena socialis]|eukprot:PNH08345.1 SNF1-related protein kinase catalytic subunit alpha KIN11 [Tetrabaena socialis]